MKPTALGLELSADLCQDQLLELVTAAGDQDAFVRIDMEDSSHTDKTLDLYERVRMHGHENVGVVLQAMLRRTVADARRLAGQSADVRICKGIYQEPEAIAYVRDDDVRQSFRETLDVLVDGGARVAVATHDEALVAAVARLAAPRRRGRRGLRVPDAARDPRGPAGPDRSPRASGCGCTSRTASAGTSTPSGG